MTTNERTPGIVMTMHLWGIDSDQRTAARRFADAGFAVVVPDLYARFDAPNGDGATDYTAFVPFARQLTPETVDSDIRAAAEWLREQCPDAKTGIAGFCMRGAMAWRRSAGEDRAFSAAAIWYGSIPDTDPALIDTPVVGSFGIEDTGIPAQRVRAFTAGLRVPNDIVLYPAAKHGFADETRAEYEPIAAEASWQRTIAFLREHLG